MRSHRKVPLVLSLLGSMSLSAALTAHEGPHAEGLEPMTVQSVVSGGAAEAAGVAVGDRLVELGGIEIATLGDLEQAIGRRRPGDEVPLVVRRDGTRVELSLTFGERADGRASLGLSLAVMNTAGDGPVDAGLTREECHAWIAGTYDTEAMAQRFDLDLGPELEDMRACLARDVGMMSEPIPYGWCDNIFKVHCSGLDLLAQIGEAQNDWCEGLLSDALGRDLGGDPDWSDCAADRLFERYSTNGQASDEAACRVAFEECSAQR